MTPARDGGGGLQIIFAIFLGLMVTAFVGVGVYTFHPSPAEPLEKRIQSLVREEREVADAKPDADKTPADRARMQELRREADGLRDQVRAANQDWGRMTSIILIAFATLVMAISVLRADHLPVVGNGLLLGGVFTMVYGVGTIIATNSSVARFLILTVALAITIGIGWVRFVRRRDAAASGSPSGAASLEGLSELEQRIRGLEQRLDEAAGALARRS